MAFVSLETLGKPAQNTPQTPPNFIGKSRASRQKHLLSTRTIDSDDATLDDVIDLAMMADALDNGAAAG